MLALLGGAARSACSERLWSGHQGGSCDEPPPRAPPLLPWRCTPPLARSLQPPRAPSSASGTPARAAFASHTYTHPIPIALHHPCSLRCPPHPHLRAPRSAPQTAPQPSTHQRAARGASLAAGNDFWLYGGLRSIKNLIAQSFEGWLYFVRFRFLEQMCTVVLRVCEPGGRARRGWPVFSCFCVSECFVRFKMYQSYKSSRARSPTTRTCCPGRDAHGSHIRCKMTSVTN